MTFAIQINFMRKTALLFSLAAASFCADAQVTLSGTSYTQDFASLGLSTPTVPAGWFGYTDATATSAGVLSTISTSKNYGVFADTVQGGGACKINIQDDAFKNYPSANGGNTVKTATCDQQKLFTDRALGVRQKGNSTPPATPLWDPGAAIVFKIANTSGRSAFNLNFKLQSLDTALSPRITTWVVDYGIGGTPTAFTPVTATGTMTTGGYVFSNNSISVNFGSALDNKSSTVWIRIVTLTPSTGSGNRASTAIDDFNLTWTGTGTSVVETVNTLPAATLAAYGEPTNDKVTFGYNVDETGTYNLNIHDITGRQVYTGSFNTEANGIHTVNGLNLASGLYVARMSNSNGATAVTKFSVK